MPVCVVCVDLRCQLSVVDEVLQWVAAAELVQQSGQVADECGGVGGVDEARHVADLDHRHVAIGVHTWSSGDLWAERLSSGPVML